MFEWLMKLLKPQPERIFTGAIPDDRPESVKLGDVHFEEIVASANPVSWPALDTSRLPSWPIFDQGSTSSCVAFTKALMSSILYELRIGVWIRFSARWIYSKRRNKPQGGMIGVDAFDIEAASGIVPEDMVPSERLTEAQISDYSSRPWEMEVGKALRMSDQRIILPKGDIEAAASVQQTTGKPIMVWFMWHYEEWVKNVPAILRPAPPYHHSTTFVPPRAKGESSFGIYQGEKAIVIQDSWGIANGTLAGKRIITERFYRERNTFAAYSMRFRFDEGVGDRPVYDGSIVSVQKCLRYEGVFPTNVDFYENVGPTTKKSLAQFQQKHGLAITSKLDEATVQLLKQLYS